MLFLSCFCYAFVRVCLLMPCGHPHQIWDFYLKQYRRYADSTRVPETRSEVKVTMTQGWNTTLRYPKMHPHTEFGIPTSNNKRYAPDKIILKLDQRSRSQ